MLSSFFVFCFVILFESAIRCRSLMGMKAWQTGILIFLLWERLTFAVSVPVRVPFCPKDSISNVIFGFRDSYCPISYDFSQSIDFVGVTEVLWDFFFAYLIWFSLSILLISSLLCGDNKLYFYCMIWCYIVSILN